MLDFCATLTETLNNFNYYSSTKFKDIKISTSRQLCNKENVEMANVENSLEIIRYPTSRKRRNCTRRPLRRIMIEHIQSINSNDVSYQSSYNMFCVEALVPNKRTNLQPSADVAGLAVYLE